MEILGYKTQVCKRCRCQFVYERQVVGVRERSRRLCDPCAPKAKAEAAAQFSARRKVNMATVREGWKNQRDPFQDLAVRGYASVGRLMGISGEAVRQLEASGFIKARKLLLFEQLKTRVNNGQSFSAVSDSDLH